MHLRIKSILQNASLWAMVGVALRIGSGIITLPIALRVLSSAELGLYYTFLGITSVVALFDCGFSHATIRNAAYAMGGAKEFQASGVAESAGLGEPNWQLLRQLIAAVQIWYRLIGSLLAVLLLFVGTWFLLPIIRNADLSSSNIGCWCLFAVATSYSFFTTYWTDILYGIGSVKSVTLIQISSQLVGISLLAGGLLGGLGLWSYGISALVGFLIIRLTSQRVLKRNAKAAFAYEVSTHERNQVLNRLWPMAWRQGLVMIGAYLTLRSNTLICSAKLGLEETGSFGLSLNLINMILQIAMVPVGLSMPLIGRLRVERDFAQIRRVFTTRLYGGLVLGAMALLVVSFVGNSLLAIIDTQTPLLTKPLFLLLALILCLEQHHSQYTGLVLTENKNPFVWPAILSGLAIVTLSWLVVGTWGLLGIILVQGLVQLSWNNWFPVVRGMQGLRVADSSLHSQVR